MLNNIFANGLNSPEALKALRMLLVAVVPAMLGIILHEVMHGYVAWRHGDPTARALGRLTLNPIKHIDPVGLLVFVITSIAGGFVFGWAKPVPVNMRYFRNPARGMMWTALAGPMTNFALVAIFTALLWSVVHLAPDSFWLEWKAGDEFSPERLFVSSLQAGIMINLGLAWLNLLPIPPLDGSKVLAYFLPQQAAYSFLRLERYGFVILLTLLFTHALDSILTPLIRGSANWLLQLI